MAVHVGIDDARCKAVTLHRRLPTWRRLDVLPFVFFYSADIYYLAFAHRSMHNNMGLMMLPIIVILHTLAFLCSQWSVAACCWLGYEIVANIEAAEVARVIPAPYCGSSAIVDLQRTPDKPPSS
jgi:hypothetical protein